MFGSLVLFVLAGLFLITPAQAQELPSLLVVPSTVAQVQPNLVEERELLQLERTSLHDKVTALNADCSAVDERNTAKVTSCTNIKHELYGALTRHIERSNAFNEAVNRALTVECAKWSEQLDRDKTSLQRQQKSIEMGLDELHKWTSANEEAKNDALKAAAVLLFGAVGEKLKEKVKSLRGFKAALTQYRNQVEEGIPIDLLQAKIEKAAHGYTMAMISITAGHVGEGGKTLADTLDVLKNEVAVIGGYLRDSDASVIDVLEDQDVKKLLDSDGATTDLTRSLGTLAAHSEEIEKLSKVVGPGADLGQFIADYGYNAKKWWESRARIIQQNNLSDQELRAVDSLKSQIECTMHRIEDCRTGNQIRSCNSSP